MWVTSGAPFAQAGDGVWYVAHAGRQAGARHPRDADRARPHVVSRPALRRLDARAGHRDRGALLGLRRARASRHRRVIIPAHLDRPPRARAPSRRDRTAGSTSAPAPSRTRWRAVTRPRAPSCPSRATAATCASRPGACAARSGWPSSRAPRRCWSATTGATTSACDRPPDELNLVRDVTRAAPDFGFPDCYDQGGRACAATSRAARAPARPCRRRRRRRHARLGRPGPDRLRGRERLDRARASTPGASVRRIELRRRPGGGYDASGSVFATGFGEQDALGTAIGPGRRALPHAVRHRRRGALLPRLWPLIRAICPEVLKLDRVGGDTAVYHAREPQAQRRLAAHGAHAGAHPGRPARRRAA